MEIWREGEIFYSSGDAIYEANNACKGSGTSWNGKGRFFQSAKTYGSWIFVFKWRRDRTRKEYKLGDWYNIVGVKMKEEYPGYTIDNLWGL